MYIHPLAEVQSKNIGKGTRIWQFCVVLKDATIGEDCNINCHTFIENDVIIGNMVTVKSGVYLWDGLRIADKVFIGPGVVFTNDQRPRSKHYKPIMPTLIGEGATLGANSTILPGIKIGRYSMTGAGSLISRDVPDYALVIGSPARIVGWIDENGDKLSVTQKGIYTSQDGRQFKVINNRLVNL